MELSMNRLLHIVLNDYINDNRVRRAAECGQRSGFDVTVFALSKYNKRIRVVNAGVNIVHFFIFLRKWPKSNFFQFFKYLEMILRMTYEGKRMRPAIIHSHDLNALVIGYLISKITGSKLIYDSHEYWQDANPNRVSKVVKLLLKRVEKFLIKRADICVTVSCGIAKLLEDDYNIAKPEIIRNLPERWDTGVKKKLRKSLGIDKRKIIFLYQGVINGPWVFDLLEAFENLNNDNAVLVYLGNGDKVEDLKSKGVMRVYFHPSVNFDDLPAYTSDADVGVHTMYGDIKNQLFALPNKLFEYIQGGLSLIVSDLPEMSALVHKHNIGLTFTPGSKLELCQCLNEFVENEKLRMQCRLSISEIRNSYTWNEEEKRLKSLYLNLLEC
jgi:glycosyltransferase involved in cell wall biosynthesis